MAYRKLLVGLVLVGISFAGLPASAGAAGGRGDVGAAGGGDALFPFAGNGGYDVQRYQLNLDWNPNSNVLRGSERIAAITTQSLRSFNLDLTGLTVKKVQVNGRAARFIRVGQELIVTPSEPLPDHRRFAVALEYSGVPKVITDPDGTFEGWVPTRDGVFVVGEPQGSQTWFAVNNSPADKAIFDVSMTVPDGLTAVGNGRLVSQQASGGRRTFRWVECSPMAPYLATITVGRFDVARGFTAGGIPTYVAVDPSQAAAARPVLAKLPAMVDFFSKVYGQYPFDIVGAIVDDAPKVGYALETQTKPVFDTAPDETTLVHELAHQWFGDAVTLTKWSDIWLNEGFATWSEWLWAEHTGGRSAHDTFVALRAEPAGSDLWAPAPAGLVDPADIFARSVYDRGAMSLQALREKIGDKVFFHVLRTWYREHRYGNVTTGEFVALSERLSHQDLKPFFRTWLYSAEKPSA